MLRIRSLMLTPVSCILAALLWPAVVMGQTTNVAIVPQIAAGSFDGGLNSYSTAIQIINSETTPVTISAQFYTQNGTPSTLSFQTNLTTAPSFQGSLSSVTIASNDSIIIRTAAAFAASGVVNWGRIQANNSVTIAALFEVTDARGNSVSRVGVPASRPDGVHMVIPRIRNVQRVLETGFAVVNAGDTPAEVTARLYSGGQVVAQRTLILGPKNHSSHYFFQFFNLTNEGSGFNSWTHVDLHSNAPSLAVMALLLEGNQLSPQNTLGGYSFMDNCSLVTGQLWKFVSLASKGYSGYYQLTTFGQQNQQLCLESGAYNKATGTGVGAHMASCAAGQLFTGQMWKLAPATGGFRLQSKYREEANQCLEGNKVASGSTLGGISFMDACADVTGEIWTRIPDSEFGSIPAEL